MLIRLAYVLLWLAAVSYFISLKTVKPWPGRVATGLTVTSWALLTAGLVQRSMASGHWPLTNRYEFALALVWAIVGLYLLLEVSWRQRRAGVFVLGIALAVATYAFFRPPDEQVIAPLLPVLRSPWLQLHVLTTLVGFGAFGVAAGLGLMQLVWPTPAGETEADGFRGSEIECTVERVLALGFPWLTLGILTGAIWAQNAWGRYWGWDPKESWALITWLWYLLILHVRPLRSWRGRRLAGLVVAGFGIVLFTFVGVPWLVRTVRLESLHGF